MKRSDDIDFHHFFFFFFFFFFFLVNILNDTRSRMPLDGIE